ncbi:MAG: sporulation protein YqfD [Epulopiscium sp. Nele67-Bin005]|nr:MAG: sporulation protein YqfD [Epulopiscium sp. Nele67-Bin005]
MYLSLWNYFKGYVIVEISGHKIEKFINGALKDGNTFWDVKQNGQTLTFKTTPDGFKRLKPMVARSKCEIRILDKKGLPFVGFRYRKRKLLALGAFIFVFWFYTLTSFIWLVEVSGNQNIEEADIVQSLKEGGYTTGKLKKDLNLREAEQYLINHYPEILWAGINYEGTKLAIQITEAVTKPELHNQTTPTDIVAKRDGIITYIATNTGIPNVKKGDTVKKGDILVSGQVHLESDVKSDVKYVYSQAEISAQTSYALEAKLPIEQTSKHYTGDTATSYSVRLFDNKFDIFKGKTDSETYDTLLTLYQLRLTDLFPLPFYWIKEDKVPYTPYTNTVEIEQIQETLEGELHDALREKITDDGVILKKELNFEEIDGYIVGTLYALVEEDISVQVPIQFMQQEGEIINDTNTN